MPVDGTRVTTLYAYAIPGPPQAFSAKAVSADVSGDMVALLGDDLDGVMASTVKHGFTFFTWRPA